MGSSLVALSPNAMPLPRSETPYITPDWCISSFSASLFLAFNMSKRRCGSVLLIDRFCDRV